MEHMQDGPVANQGWQTHGDFDAEVHHLPRTSAAEFRAAAWEMWSTESLYTRDGVYLPWLGFRGLLAVALALAPASVIWGLARGMTADATEWALMLGGTAVMMLLIVSKRRSNQAVRRRLRRNVQLEQMSREIDDLVQRGEIPHAPPGWQGTVLAALS